MQKSNKEKALFLRIPDDLWLIIAEKALKERKTRAGLIIELLELALQRNKK